MMRWNGLGRSLLFGAFAAAAFVPFSVIGTPLFGWSGAVAAYAVASGAAYLLGIGPTARKGFVAAGIFGLGLALFAPLAGSDRDVVLAAALGLGVLRSGLLYHSRFARAVLIEALLLGLSLSLAGRLFDGSVVSTVLAIWAFYLVQSAFFVVGGVRRRRDEADELDPFDAARARALAVLEEVGVGEIR